MHSVTLLSSHNTDAECCTNSFLKPTDLREVTAGLNIHNMITIEEEQHLFPDITFTCNGFIAKWIVGAGIREMNIHYTYMCMVFFKINSLQEWCSVIIHRVIYIVFHRYFIIALLSM